MRRAFRIVCVSSIFAACGDADDAQTSGSPTASTTAPTTTVADSTGGDDDTTGDASGSPTTAAMTDDPATSAPTSGDPTLDTSDPTDTDGPTTDPGAVELPPPDGGLDYQLGEPYDPPRGVQIVSRDRNATPAPGLYNICYVNGFQAQPDEEDFWLEQHPDLVLRDDEGNPVIDPDWDEMLLDTSTPEKRNALADIVGGWIAGCRDAGFDAVEIDNLDTYSRSDGRLTQDDAVATMALFSAAAHDVGLAIAQKNSTEILARAGEMGTDFAVAEECSTYSECGDYVDVYGDAVLMIEYEAPDFATGCAEFPGHSIVLRDLYLVGPGDGDYVFEAC
jgi:hypothetical protein